MAMCSFFEFLTFNKRSFFKLYFMMRQIVFCILVALANSLFLPVVAAVTHEVDIPVHFVPCITYWGQKAKAQSSPHT